MPRGKRTSIPQAAEARAARPDIRYAGRVPLMAIQATMTARISVLRAGARMMKPN